ncbi:hypothetical protein PHISCL_03904 [Aspergillus sclerotialis]|uniref:Uncharacterized protein n=1 Tax=Aspergillus sclerotialis TaxID=2070753 RepID=A0A3A2ZWT9_9EURO|nr:hypothetical protein PHISCL_03904 [Aspergillus sclerotialis]
MSLPKYSNSPSVSSPNPVHVEPTDQPADQTYNSEEDDDRQHESQHHQFQPFFTLIEDLHTSEYFHPTVHYIFSDDDTDIVTEAALRSLEDEHEPPKGTRGNTVNVRDQYRDEEGGKGESGRSSPRKEALLPPSIPGVRDNYIILDLDGPPSDPSQESGPETGTEKAEPSVEGRSPSTSPATQQPQPNPAVHQTQPEHKQQQTQRYTITSSQSLTPAWQVLQTDLLPAPTFETTNDTTEPVGGLMLKIRGTSGLPPTIPTREKEREGGSQNQRLEEMMEQFAKRMEELRGVIESGGEVGKRDKGEMDVLDRKGE